MAIVRTVIGDTLEMTFVSSGVTFSPIWGAVYDGSESLVSSWTMQSSGNGHYYYNHTTATTPGFYDSRMTGYVNSAAYKRNIRFQLVEGEVD